MRSKSTAVALLLLVAGGTLRADSGGFKKAYFGATRPGSWAKYTMSMPGFPDSTSLYTRQPDEKGEARIQIRSDFQGTAQASKSFTNYRLKKGYALEKDALDFGKAVVGLSVSAGDDKATELQGDALKNVRAAMADYSKIAKFSGTETVAGKPCDRYTYSIKRPGKPPQIEKGDICLSDAVPFGLIRQSAVTKDSSGKVISQYTMTLTDSGAGALAGASTAAPVGAETAKKAAAGRLTLALAEAFKKERVQLEVEVLAAPKGGANVRVVFKNKGEAPLDLVIPAGATALEVGTPIETLRLSSPARKTLTLAPGQSSPPTDLTQTGDYRPVKGKFVVSVYEGTPLFSGSVTMDHVK